MNILPLMSPPSEALTAFEPLPVYRDVAWDHEAKRPLFRGGEAVIVEGAEAVKSWAWRTLQTERYRHEIFSSDHGCELMNLVGQPYREDTKLAEAVRYIQEALMQSPYITAVAVTEASFEGDALSMTCKISTVYGEVGVRV